jgi:hypothetical protein
MAKATKAEREIMLPEEELMENIIQEEPASAPAPEPTPEPAPEPPKVEEKKVPVQIVPNDMIRIQSLTTGIWQYNKSIYSLSVGGFYIVEKSLGDSLIARNEAMPA